MWDVSTLASPIKPQWQFMLCIDLDAMLGNGAITFEANIQLTFIQIPMCLTFTCRPSQLPLRHDPQLASLGSCRNLDASLPPAQVDGQVPHRTPPTKTFWVGQARHDLSLKMFKAKDFTHFKKTTHWAGRNLEDDGFIFCLAVVTPTRKVSNLTNFHTGLKPSTITKHVTAAVYLVAWSVCRCSLSNLVAGLKVFKRRIRRILLRLSPLRFTICFFLHGGWGTEIHLPSWDLLRTEGAGIPSRNVDIQAMLRTGKSCGCLGRSKMVVLFSEKLSRYALKTTALGG